MLPAPAGSTTTSDPSAPADRRRTRRWRGAPLVVAALALVAAACAPPGSPGSGVTGDVVSAVNADRAASGLAPLGWDDQLYGLAQNHADEIAASQSLWHSDLAGWINAPWMSDWRALGENLAEAPPGTTGSQIEDLWMGSAPHRANILNGGFNHIGVGVTVDSAGRVWVVALFGTR